MCKFDEKERKIKILHTKQINEHFCMFHVLNKIEKILCYVCVRNSTNGFFRMTNQINLASRGEEKKGVLSDQSTGLEALTCLQSSSDNKYLYAATQKGPIKVWKWTSKVWKEEKDKTLYGHNTIVTSLDLMTSLHHGNRLISGSVNGGVKIWDLRSYRLVGSVRCDSTV